MLSQWQTKKKLTYILRMKKKMEIEKTNVKYHENFKNEKPYPNDIAVITMTESINDFPIEPLQLGCRNFRNKDKRYALGLDTEYVQNENSKNKKFYLHILKEESQPRHESLCNYAQKILCVSFGEDEGSTTRATQGDSGEILQ